MTTTTPNRMTPPLALHARTAADLMKKAMINVSLRLAKEKRKAKMILQVHDELVLDVPEAEVDAVTASVKEEMETVSALDVPLKVDSSQGGNWAEME